MGKERNEKGQFVKGGYKDYTGIKKNMLTMVELDHIHVAPNGAKIPYWVTRCECGSEVVKSIKDVISGHTKSCGCLHKINTSKARKIHGESDTRLYYIWENMKKRCYNKNIKKFKNYGGRGIVVCDEWLKSYKTFSDWAKQSGYEENLTIERIDVDGNYEPSNCKWITMEEQAKNKTSNIHIKIDNVSFTPLELSEKYSLPVKTIYARLSRGDEGEDIVRPLGERRFYKR